MIDELSARYHAAARRGRGGAWQFTPSPRRDRIRAGRSKQTCHPRRPSAHRVEKGGGRRRSRRRLSPTKAGTDLEATCSGAPTRRPARAHVEEPRIGQILLKTDSVRTSLQATTRNLAPRCPRSREVTATPDACRRRCCRPRSRPRSSSGCGAVEAQRLFGGQRRRANPPATSRRAPAIEVRP